MDFLKKNLKGKNKHNFKVIFLTKQPKINHTYC